VSIGRLAFGLDGFLAALLCALLLGLVYPAPGASGGLLHMPSVTKYGIALMFFLHGAALSPDSLIGGAKNWRLHLPVQLTTFALFPVLGVMVVEVVRRILPQGLLAGYFYLCALSSTTSSSVALTALARGNIAGALFNATLSGLLGMVITPVLMGILAHTSGQTLLAGQAIVDILVKLLLPFVLGQMARPLVLSLITRYQRWLSTCDRAVIVLIVYSSFCDSTLAGVWSRHGIGVITLVVAITALLLLAAVGISLRASRALKLSREDEIAGLFCGVTKSLVNGIPIARVLFAGDPAIGLIVLPVMVYHPMQLILCTWLARRYAAQP
jgi:solute carrier family 10 (sodium/bile acid cotransporter), member 7